MKEKIGKHLAVIIDLAGPGGGVGRSNGDAPEIDGKLHIASRRPYAKAISSP